MKQRICQSCGMSMPTDDLLGTHGNGCLCTEYCCHCFQKGFFTNNSLEEQIELNTQPESLFKSCVNLLPKPFVVYRTNVVCQFVLIDGLYLFKKNH